jgi:hypothetical protein
MRDLFLTELITKVKPYTNSVEVHPQLSNNRHPVDGALVGAGSLWPTCSRLGNCLEFQTCFSCRPVPLQLFKNQTHQTQTDQSIS